MKTDSKDREKCAGKVSMAGIRVAGLTLLMKSISASAEDKVNRDNMGNIDIAEGFTTAFRS